jgi:hypothetical protein
MMNRISIPGKSDKGDCFEENPWFHRGSGSEPERQPQCQTTGSLLTAEVNS